MDAGYGRGIWTRDMDAGYGRGIWTRDMDAGLDAEFRLLRLAQGHFQTGLRGWDVAGARVSSRSVVRAGPLLLGLRWLVYSSTGSLRRFWWEALLVASQRRVERLALRTIQVVSVPNSITHATVAIPSMPSPVHIIIGMCSEDPITIRIMAAVPTLPEPMRVWRTRGELAIRSVTPWGSFIT